MTKLAHIAASELLAELSARIAETAADWVSAFGDDGLRTDEAAVIAGVSAETVRRWCTEGTDAGEPIGVLIAGAVWLVSEARLLRAIERRRGVAERQAAEARARRISDPPQNLSKTSANSVAAQTRATSKRV